ncbi:MAG: DoxX family protein [Bacteroidetes bacterium]|nr:MAG: DoxX family protein [Bacteroidota bacterium]
MGMLHQLEKWSTTHHPRWLVFLRVALGISLFLKGITFLSNSVRLEGILLEAGISQYISWLALVITWLHLLCGVFIVIGLFTRLSTMIMIPILFFAVVFVNASHGIFAAESEFAFSLIILLMLIFFFIEGGGPVSMDDYFKNYKRNQV